MAEIVYILTNPAMPGLIKIGRTSKSVEERMQGLYTAGVPFPFECFYAARIEDSAKIETALHNIFSDKRVKTNREFFQVEANRAKMVLELVAVEDVTPQIDAPISTEDVEALSEKERKEPFRFSLAKVPVGAVLQFMRDKSKTCRVVDDKYVEFDGKVTSLSSAASLLLEEMGWKSTQVQGPLYWSYEEESLVARRSYYEANSSDRDI